MEYFQQELERQSGGRIRVEPCLGGVLGNKHELKDFAAVSAVQGASASLPGDLKPAPVW